MRGLGLIVAATVAALLMAACGNDPSGSDTPVPAPGAPTNPAPTGPTSAGSGPQPTGAVSATGSPVTATPDGEHPLSEEDGAALAVETFWSVRDAVSQREEDLQALVNVTVGTARDTYVSAVRGDLARGYTQVGATKVDILDVSIEGQQGVVRACAELAEVEILDVDGASVVPEARPDRFALDYTVERDDRTAGGWVLSNAVTAEDERCVG